MARSGFVTSLLAGMAERANLQRVFDYMLDNWRLGVPEDQSRAENLQAYYYSATTPGVANTEFSIPHSLGRPPYLLVPVLALELGEQLVPLTVSRTPDASRIYLKSSATNAPIRVLVEG